VTTAPILTFGGSCYRIAPAGRVFIFEDHPWAGPTVVDADGDPLPQQPAADHLFWAHVNAWAQQGKQFKEVSGARWCIYETDQQAVRRLRAELRTEKELAP
jgi:hypothetical protein